MGVLRKRLQQNFSRAAADYDVRAQFQHVQTRRVLDAALMAFPRAARIVDVGCGTGYFAGAAQHQRPDWCVVGVDIAPGMCAVAKSRCQAVAGDAAWLPLLGQSVDAAVSSLCYQWVENQPQAFGELLRVMKPGGWAVIASLGEATLQELRGCAQEAQLPLRLLPMRGFAQCKGDLLAAGFEISLADQRVVTEHYASVNALLESMRSIGAGNNFDGQARPVMGPKRWRAMLAQYERLRTGEGIPATWEHHFFVLHKPS